jgi:succinate dehydrogenase/fumarate reductase iron-sulfur protein
MQPGDLLNVTIKKYDPTRDDAPYYRTYSVPYKREMRILEVLDSIVEEQGESLAYQWYCGVKKCGMCGMTVNGRPMLACWEPAEPDMVIEPLANFPVIRDLVIDRGQYMQNMLALRPVLQRVRPYTGFPEAITGVQMAPAAEAMHCIECLLCVSVCPTYGPDFVGPAPLVQLARFALDPRDGGPRAKLAINVGGIENCVSCYQCTQACPLNIHVLEVCIDGLRRQIVEQNLGDIAHHNQVYADLVLEQGVVNPSILMIRSLKWRVLRELPAAIRMFLRGRLSLREVLKSLFRREGLTSQSDVQTLAKAVDEMDWEDGQ